MVKDDALDLGVAQVFTDTIEEASNTNDLVAVTEKQMRDDALRVAINGRSAQFIRAIWQQTVVVDLIVQSRNEMLVRWIRAIDRNPMRQVACHRIRIVARNGARRRGLVLACL